MLKHYSDPSETKAMDSRSWTGNNTFEHTSNKTRSTVITKHCKRHFLKAAAKPQEIRGDYPHLSPSEWRLGLTARSDKLPCNHKACHSHIPQKARKVSLLLILKPFWRLLLSVISVPSVGLHHVCFPCGREMADDHREARDHSRNSRKCLCTKTVRVSQETKTPTKCCTDTSFVPKYTQCLYQHPPVFPFICPPAWISFCHMMMILLFFSGFL